MTPEERRLRNLGRPEGERRQRDTSLEIFDDSHALSEDDLMELKKMLQYWRFGKWTIAAVVGTGTIIAGVWNFLADHLTRGLH